MSNVRRKRSKKCDTLPLRIWYADPSTMKIGDLIVCSLNNCLQASSIFVLRKLDFYLQEEPVELYDSRGLYQRMVNWIQHTFCTYRILLYNSLETLNLRKWSAIWILRGPWMRKISAPSSHLSRLENCAHPLKIGFFLVFVRRQFFLQTGVSPAPSLTDIRT